MTELSFEDDRDLCQGIFRTNGEDRDDDETNSCEGGGFFSGTTLRKGDVGILFRIPLGEPPFPWVVSCRVVVIDKGTSLPFPT